MEQLAFKYIIRFIGYPELVQIVEEDCRYRISREEVAARKEDGRKEIEFEFTSMRLCLDRVRRQLLIRKLPFVWRDPKTELSKRSSKT